MDTGSRFHQDGGTLVLEANNDAVFVEGAIVLSQTNLELLFNWLIVEKNNAPSTSGYKTWNAAQKIRMLLSEINLPYGIEDQCKHLKAYVHQNQDWQHGDGPEVITRIRNALVHAQKKKRNQLVMIDAVVRNEALQLSLWYVERILLHILGYRGKYYNRMSKLVEVIK